MPTLKLRLAHPWLSLRGFTEYAAEKIRSLVRSAPELRARWSDPEQRADIIARLAERGISFEQLAEQAQQPDADPFSLRRTDNANS